MPKSSNKKSADTTVKVETGTQPKVAKSVNEIADWLFDMVEECFENVIDPDVHPMQRIERLPGDNEGGFTLILKDGSVYAVEVMPVRGPR